jgi:hypothetical protein
LFLFPLLFVCFFLFLSSPHHCSSNTPPLLRSKPSRESFKSLTHLSLQALFHICYVKPFYYGVLFSRSSAYFKSYLSVITASF